MSTVHNKVILITGASKGMGANMALKLAGEGARIIVNYVSNAAEADEVVKTIRGNGGSAIAIKADVSKESEVTALFDAAIGEYGRIDVLINNAGVMDTKLLKDNTEADFDKHFNINVKGTFHTLKEAAAKLADNGTIINFSTTLSRLMVPTYAVYSATKAAVEQLTRVFAKEIGRGINVNAVAPGPVATELFLRGKSEEAITRFKGMNAFNRLGQPEDISKVVLFLASDDAKWISGQIIGVNGAMA
ncbi:SDR family oxidoreductase [Chitinophaga sp. GCM10012297]|uniref:SDR family oxidoreductase n=1 Tax=Chitinophaga chungangae TaxID=2821488 RepID=A0ABS3YAN6_9BACT|nr:SDR family oxidoreductase [Chitinophaga chungangae]MBO9151739.1 SDR family oxidoreductase [Chitinophaga chungangae]